MITFHILTLFPKSFSYIRESIIGRAARDKKIAVILHNLRDFGEGKRKTVDDKPYGGGPGMVLKALPIIRAVEAIQKKKRNAKVILLAADGKPFTALYARKLALRAKDVILIAGHYEGVDERVKKILKAEKISIGPYILTGGELPSLVIVDATARFIQGVLGKSASLEEKRLASPETYTRPSTIVWKKKKYAVPHVLLSGDHKRVEEWKSKKIKG